MGSTIRRRVNPLARQVPRPGTASQHEQPAAAHSPAVHGPTEPITPRTEPAAPTSTRHGQDPPDPKPSPLAYSVSMAAAALGISEYSVYEMVRANRLPHVRIGRRILIPSKLLDVWLATTGSWSPADTL